MQPTATISVTEYPAVNSNSQLNNRLNGLDSLRAFAILIVLLYHYMVVVSGEHTFGYFTQIGWMGVDLFFVLSGYLIGNQLLSALAKHQTFSIKRFYSRRLLRTLPNYYLVLSLYFIFQDSLTGAATAPTWQFLSFTQNFEFRPMATFSHSWSLCIEEQFYLVFPLLLMLLARSKHFVLLSWLMIAGGMLLGIGLRLNAWFSYGEAAMTFPDYYQHIYYSSFTRFDELLPGIALAMLKNFHPKQFAALLPQANRFLLLGLLSVAALFYCFPNYHFIRGEGHNFWLSIVGYSWVALSFALLTLAALSPASWLSRLRIPGAASIALWSYAIYLIHKPLFKLLIAPLTALGIDVKAPFGVALIMGLSILAGWLMYLLVETPFMRLRERYFPANNTAATNPLKQQNATAMLAGRANG